MPKYSPLISNFFHRNYYRRDFCCPSQEEGCNPGQTKNEKIEWQSLVHLFLLALILEVQNRLLELLLKLLLEKKLENNVEREEEIMN